MTGTFWAHNSFVKDGTLPQLDSFRPVEAIDVSDSFVSNGTLIRRDSFTLYVTIGVDDSFSFLGTLRHT